MAETLSARGVVFWPVGTGDSTTIVVDENVVVQVDLNDMAKADADDTAEVAVVDRLIEGLPVGADGRPYLAVFVLTHADLDHCCGFPDLLSEVTIGELWATPRLWRELEEEGATICESARAFQEEAERRIGAIKEDVAAGRQTVSGDRVLVIGYDTDHDKHAYSELPDQFLAYPGQAISTLDGVDCSGRFEAFLHAPFKDDCAAARNETSVAMQVTLTDQLGAGQFLLFGDLSHDTIMKIFTYSTDHDRADRLAWDVLLAPHHCSKSVMYTDGVRQQDVLDALENNAKTGARVVSSSHPIPTSNVAGDNPPHRIAKDRYVEIVDEFLCTMEHGSATVPSPIVFTVDAAGIHLVDPEVVDAAERSLEAKALARPGRLGRVAAAAAAYGREKAAASRSWRKAPVSRSPGAEDVRAAVVRDRGTTAAPATPVGFGRR